MSVFFPPAELKRLEIILGPQIMNEHLGPNNAAQHNKNSVPNPEIIGFQSELNVATARRFALLFG